MFTKNAWLLPANDGISASSDVEFDVFFPYNKSGGLGWCLSKSLSWPIELSIQSETMNVAWAATRGFNYDEDVIY